MIVQIVVSALLCSVQVGLVVLLFVRLNRAGGVFRCPACRSNVANDYITEQGVECPHCEWRLLACADSNVAAIEPAGGSEYCPACDRPITSAERIRLFDGCDYCRACVEQASPELAAFARRNESLEDDKPRSLPESILAAVCLTTMLACLITLLFFVVGVVGISISSAIDPPRQLDWWELLKNAAFLLSMFFAYTWCFFGLICPLGVIAINWALLPRKVRIKDGRLWIHPPGDQFWDLREIRWAEASSNYDRVESWRWPFSGQGIVLFPHRARLQKFGYLVGRDPEMRALWKSFLTLAEVPVQQIRPWKKVAETDE